MAKRKNDFAVVEVSEETEAEGEAVVLKDAPAVEATNISQLEREWMNEIKHLETLVEKAEAEMHAAQAEVKACKKSWESCVARLRRIIRRGPDAQQQLPFGDGVDADEPVEDTSWREIPISDALELTDKQLEKLEAVDVTNMGHLEDLRAGKLSTHPRGLLDIKGFGQAAIDVIEEEILEWWDARNRLQAAISGIPDDPEEDDDE